MRTCLAFVLAATLASSARAQTPPAAGPQSNPHLAAAQRLYQRLDLDAALAELKEAEGQAKDEDETVQILIYRGLIYAETGKSSEAQDMFKRALAMRPWAEVPPETSPRLGKVFADARKSLWGSGGAVKPPPKKKAAAPPAEANPAK